MELKLHGRKAFVSGSTQGIGFAIASALLDEGVSVTINGRSEETVDDALRRLKVRDAGAAVTGIVADFGDERQTARLIAELGDVDVLVNNVGLFELAAFSDIGDDDWQRYFDVNVMSAVRLSRHALPKMLAKRWGRILFIGSESGVNIPADMVHYGVTKAAMLALSNGLSKLTRGTEVTVNTIVGGPTYSDGVAATVTTQAQAQAQGIAEDAMKTAIIGENRTSLLERFIEPDEIASLALYLASPLSSATNGAALRADGGVLTTIV